MYFANSNQFIDRVQQEVELKGKELRLMVLHCGSMSSIDATALQQLKELVVDLNEKGIGVYFSEVIGPVRDFLHTTGFSKEIGEDHFFTHVHRAVSYLDNGAEKRDKQMLSRALQTNVFQEKTV